MISREQFDAYNRAAANLLDGVQREIESRIASWLQTDEGRSVSVAECREYAKSVMSGVVQVYDSRKSAGEFRHFHRRCDCKVVPGFEDGKDAELVEGVRPKELRELWREFKDIDDDCSLTGEKREALKRRALNLAAVDPASSAGYSSANLDLSGLFPGEIKKMQKKNPLEWESYDHLSRSGYKQSILHERGDASANIDVAMELDGEWHYWDMKTIGGGARVLRKRMVECHSKWVRLYQEGARLPNGIELELLDNPRVIVDNIFSKMSDGEAEDQIKKSLAHLSGRDGLVFKQVLLVLKDRSTMLIE